MDNMAFISTIILRLTLLSMRHQAMGTQPTDADMVAAMDRANAENEYNHNIGELTNLKEGDRKRK